MNAFFAFCKKECYEYVRSYKLFILLMVFLAFGFLNPLFARYLPALLADAMPDGIAMQLPIPQLLDAWAQFYKNISQLGIVIILIVFSTMLSNELQKGTLIHLFTKGLSRTTVILSKYLCAVCIWTLCYGLSFLVTYGYNFMFWPISNIPHLYFGIACVWLFGCLMISLLLLGSAITETSMGSLLCAGSFFILCMLTSMFPQLQDMQPVHLLDTFSLLQGQSEPTDFLISLFLSLSLVVLFITLTIQIFKHRQL